MLSNLAVIELNDLELNYNCSVASLNCFTNYFSFIADMVRPIESLGANMMEKSLFVPRGRAPLLVTAIPLSQILYNQAHPLIPLQDPDPPDEPQLSLPTVVSITVEPQQPRTGQKGEGTRSPAWTARHLVVSGLSQLRSRGVQGSRAVALTQAVLTVAQHCWWRTSTARKKRVKFHWRRLHTLLITTRLKEIGFHRLGNRTQVLWQKETVRPGTCENRLHLKRERWKRNRTRLCGGRRERGHLTSVSRRH